jgi:hypothetical protein
MSGAEQSRGEILLEAIHDEVEHRLNPSGEDCPECGGDGFIYDCFEEFACVDPESGCSDCERKCRGCLQAKHDRLKLVREEVVKSDDVDIAIAWLKEIGRWRDDITADQVKEQMTAERAKLSAEPPSEDQQ